MGSSDGLNVGDVTGPRWAGGARNPDAAAWHDYVLLSPGAKVSWRGTFMAGRASRDAEVEVLREQLAATQADLAEAYASSNRVKEQLAAAEAALVEFRSEDRDREVAARTVDAVAHDLAEPRALWWSNLYGPQVQTDEATGAKLSLDEWFAARAAALRSGTEGSTDA